jgi:hypothetical protein
MRREIRRFEVTTDKGRRFTLIESQSSSAMRALGDDMTGSGAKELFTSDGERVYVNHDGTYEIAGLGLTLRRIP